MTVRSHNGVLQLQKLHRSQRLATVVAIYRQDGVTQLFTDHDRPLTTDLGTHLPVSVGRMSAERREAGLRSGNQEVAGIIDGVQFLLSDLIADRYRGARLVQRVVQWDMPWLVHRAAAKVIRTIKFDGSSWTATIEGVGAKLQRPVGGEFGGVSSTKCPRILGSPTCGADLAKDTFTGVGVDVVTDDRMRFTVDTGVFNGPNCTVDDYYRDGELTWTSGQNAGTVSRVSRYYGTGEFVLLFPTKFPILTGDQATIKPGCDGLKSTCSGKFRTLLDSGTSTGGNTSTKLNDTTKTWTPNQWAGKDLCIAKGTGSVQTVHITANTSSQLTVTPAMSPVPDATSVYTIQTTSNVLNFGGVDVYAPGAGKILEPLQ